MQPSLITNAFRRFAAGPSPEPIREVDEVLDPVVSQQSRSLLKALWPLQTQIDLVRIGGDADGAYLVPDDFEGVGALFSPGIAQVSAFENEMAAKGMRCYLADASVAGPATSNEAFSFEKKFLGLRNTDVYTTLDDWVERHEPGEHDLMLQMDIEGAEWPVLSSMSHRLLKRFRIMVIEFHSLSMLYNPYADQVITEVLSRVLETHYVLHNHPNNAMWMNHKADIDIPEVIEVSFLRKDRVTYNQPVAQLPHPLDIISNPLKKNLVLPRSWAPK